MANIDTAFDGQKRTIYVLVRADISVEQQVVQSNHASAEAGRTFYSDTHGIASLVVLSVPNKEALLKAREKLIQKGVASELFFEPDWDMGYSALASRPVTDEERKYFRSWPLWTLQKALKGVAA